MPDSFAKTLKPSDPIDLSLFCHILNDPFLKGTFELEGNSFERTIYYLDTYCRGHADHAIAARVHDLLTELRYLQEKAARIATITTESGLERLSSDIATQIDHLATDKTISIPGGWETPHGGHAMTYQFKKARDAEGECLLFTVYNAGAGLDYHERRSEKDKELFYPTQTYRIPLPVNQIELKNYIKKLLLAQLPALRPTDQQAFDEKNLYEDVLPGIHFLSGRLLPAATSEHLLTASQLSGTCNQRSLQQLLKGQFATKRDYQRFIYQFKLHALKDYVAQARRSSHLEHAEVQHQIRQAVHSLQRILNVKDLFSADEKLASAEELASLLKSLPALLPRAARIPVGRPTYRDDIIPTFSITKPSSILIQPRRSTAPTPPVIKGATLGNPSKPCPLPTTGEDLITSLRSFNAQLALQDPTVAIEWVEQLLARFPLPVNLMPFGTHSTIDPFYTGITDATMDDFLQQLDLIQKKYNSALKTIGGSVASPRQLITGLSLVTILGELALTIKPARPELSQAMCFTVQSCLAGNKNNPFLATKKPQLDARLAQIKARHGNPASKVHNFFEMYNALINSEPDLKRQLNERFERSAQSGTPPEGIAKSLRDNGYQALYYFAQNRASLSRETAFAPLHKKFERQFKLEETIVPFFTPFYDWAHQQAFSFVDKPPSSYSIYATLVFSIHNHTDKLASDRYGLAPGACSEALRASFSTDSKSSMKSGKEGREDNEVQLFSCLAPTTKIDTADADEIARRQLFHLRSSPSNQIHLTLDYFKRHIDKLSDVNYQRYLEANLFQPALLIKALNDPDFITHLNAFIKEGICRNSDTRGLLPTALFFIRLQTQVLSYAMRIKTPATIAAQTEPKALAFSQRLKGLIADSHQLPVSNALHHHRFLLNMACFEQAVSTCTSADEKAIKTTEAVKNSLVDYLCSNACTRNLTMNDNADDIDLACLRHTFKSMLKEQSLEELKPLIAEAIKQLRLGTVSNLRDINYTPPEALYTVKTDAPGSPTYTIDVLSGRVYNASGMAFCPTPLHILHHPVMKYLDIKENTFCFISGDGKTIELGQPPTHRFIKEGDLYRVQRYMSPTSTSSSWYELSCFDEQQQKLFTTYSSTIELTIPAILKERHSQVWVNTAHDKNDVLLTNNHLITHQFKKNPSGPWDGFEYHNADSTSAGRLYRAYSGGGLPTLAGAAVWVFSRPEDTTGVQDSLYERLASIEASQFITISNNSGNLRITLHRYGIRLIGNKTNGAWILRLESDPKFILRELPSSLSGLAALVFEHEDNKQRKCYLPVQEFLSTGKRSSSGEYYQFKQDTEGKIALSRVKGKAITLPWQYTNTEQMLALSMNAAGEPVATTGAEALYLCYLYLGLQQPEKAWDVLEDCKKRLGGLKGSTEELKYLSWIVNSLPRSLNAGDENAIIGTPPYIACQLKAMALFTETYKPGKALDLSDQTFDEATPEGYSKSLAQQEVKAFYDGLNSTIYEKYKRYQTMQAHISYRFNLDDRARKNLLDYYHAHLPGGEPKAVGALGYEWKILRLKSMRREHAQLNAMRTALGASFPKAYAKRLQDIERELARASKVHAHHTDVELVPIDMRLPQDSDFDINEVVADVAIKTRIDRWWTSEIRDSMPVAIDKLNSTLTDAAFYDQFPSYYLLVKKANPTAAETTQQTTLIDFCKKTIMAHRHTPLDKQSRKITYACHVLLRVYCTPQAFSDDMTGQAIFKQAKVTQLPPDGQISVWQARHKTTNVLAEMTAMWEETKDLVASTSEPIHAIMDSTTTRFSIDDLLSRLPADTERNTYIEAFRTAAKQFGKKPPATAGAGSIDRALLSLEEKRNGEARHSALETMTENAKQLVGTPAARALFTEKIDEQASELTRACEELLTKMLALGNKGPADRATKLSRDLEVASEARAPLDKQRLISLYLQADKAQYALETGLTSEEIDTLHTTIAAFLKLSVRKQALTRFTKLTQAIKANPAASSLAQYRKLAYELLMEDTVDYAKDPILAVMQYHSEILLREDQQEAIKRLTGDGKPPFPENIEKIIMGGGKSKVILPALARKKATGTNLVVIEVPPALLETNYKDLSYTSSSLFNQRARLFQFSRDSDCSPESLDFLYETLCDVMVNKDYLVTTGDAIQSLELKYLELLQERPEKAADLSLWQKKVAGLERLVSLFRTRADAIIDEVHQGLELKKKLNYTIGSARPVPSDVIKHCVALYSFFDHIRLSEVSGLASLGLEGKTLTDLLLHNQLITTDEHWRSILIHVAQALITHRDSPIERLLSTITPPLSAADRSELATYIAGQATAIPACVTRSNAKTKEIIALYKEQVSQLLIRTLRRNLNEHYGPSYANPNNPVAIPYASNNTPSERSQFGNALESINLTIQMTLIKGLSRQVLKNYIQGLRQQAQQELLENPTLGSMEETPIGKAFYAMTIAEGTAGGCSLSVDIENEAIFTSIHQLLAKNKLIIRDALQSNILKKIEMAPTILHSNAMNHVDLYRSCQGVTGTPSNSATFHQRLRYDKHSAAATDGYIVKTLQEKPTLVRKLTHPAEGSSTPLQSLITRLFQGKEGSESVRAIIDICAAFKGMRNQDVAEALKAHIKTNEAQFSTPTTPPTTPLKLKYILFFNEDNILCGLSLENDRPPVIIGSSDAAIIEATLGCSADERFTYYDQAHTIGVDIAQSKKAKGLVLVDEKTQLKQFTQGCLRMRGLEEEQSVEIITPPHSSSTRLDKMIDEMARTEEKQLKEETFAAAKAKMINVIRADFMQRILELSDEDIDKKQAYMKAFEAFFLEKSTLQLYALYGGIDSMLPTATIFERFKTELIDTWRGLVKSMAIYQASDEASISEKLQTIITEALPGCDDLHLSPQRDTVGQEVEIQQQVQVEMERQVQVRRQVSHADKKPSAYVGITVLGDRYENLPSMYKKLDNVCASPSRRSTPGFSPNLFATVNYYQTYEDQTDYLDDSLKPVHALLFQQAADGKLTCVVLSQQDAEMVAQQLSNPSSSYPGAWLSTTQHTVLAGKRPDGMLTNIEYLRLIEQVRYFNGDFDLLLEGKEPKNWLAEGSVAKLEFFEKYLMASRETRKADFDGVARSLSSLQDAFKLIFLTPEAITDAYNWEEHGFELSEDDIAHCKEVQSVMKRLFSGWTYKGDAMLEEAALDLPLPVRLFYNRVIKGLNQLKFELRTIRWAKESEEAFEAIQLDLFENYVLISSSTPSLIDFLLKRACNPSSFDSYTRFISIAGFRLDSNHVQSMLMHASPGSARVIDWMLRSQTGLSLDFSESSAGAGAGAGAVAVSTGAFNPNTDTLANLYSFEPFRKDKTYLNLCLTNFSSNQGKLAPIILASIDDLKNDYDYLAEVLIHTQAAGDSVRPDIRKKIKAIYDGAAATGESAIATILKRVCTKKAEALLKSLLVELSDETLLNGIASIDTATFERWDKNIQLAIETRCLAISSRALSNNARFNEEQRRNISSITTRHLLRGMTILSFATPDNPRDNEKAKENFLIDLMETNPMNRELIQSTLDSPAFTAFPALVTLIEKSLKEEGAAYDYTKILNASKLSAEMMTFLINHYRGDMTVIKNFYDKNKALSTKLAEEHIKLMLSHLHAAIDPSNAEQQLFLQTLLNDTRLKDKTEQTLRVIDKLTDDFCIDLFTAASWWDLPPEKIQRLLIPTKRTLLLRLFDRLDNTQFNTVATKLMTPFDEALYAKIMGSAHLRAEHLLAMMDKLPNEQVDRWLPLIVQRLCNEVIATKVLAKLQDKPVSPELLAAFLGKEENYGLINVMSALYQKLGRTERETLTAAVSAHGGKYKATLTALTVIDQARHSTADTSATPVSGETGTSNATRQISTGTPTAKRASSHPTSVPDKTLTSQDTHGKHPIQAKPRPSALGTHYSFILTCITSISAVAAGGALLALGLLTLNAFFIGGGAAMMAVGISIGGGALGYSLFSGKGPKKPDEPPASIPNSPKSS